MFKKENNLKKLANIFSSLPGIGAKSAWKLVFHILTLDKEKVLNLTNTILNVHEKTKRCLICQNLTEDDVCDICKDEKRNKDVICVVETPKDVMAFENSNSFSGRYHVLHGLISPMHGIGPKQLTIKQIILTIKKNKNIKEIILATSPTTEGEATAMYIAKLIKPLNILITRIAYGMSVGSEVQYADNITILKAIENRNKI